MPNPEQIGKDIPTDELINKAVNKLPTYSQKQFLTQTGRLIGVGSILLGLGTSGILYKVYNEGEQQDNADKFPKVSREQIESANDVIGNFRLESERLAKEGKLEEIPQVLNSGTVKASYDLLDNDKKRKELEDKVWTVLDKASLLGFFLITLNGLQRIRRGQSHAKRYFVDEPKEKKRLGNFVLGIRPDWIKKPPTEEDLANFCQAISYLPPVGGKVPLTWTQRGRVHALIRLSPTLTAEQQASKVVEMRQKNRLGEVYVHHLTVQGRLPDRFKYAALALILNSPYQNDWRKPFFEAPWGKVAPLIHDGGRVNVGYNPVWKNVKGRTDFLQRISEIHEPQLEELERLGIKEVGRLSGDKLARARAEQEERNRLLIEARAYQRLALALHCRIGTVPKEIPYETQDKLGHSWDEFENKMKQLLRECRIIDAAKTRWFTSTPVRQTNWFGFGKRHEADFQPIQQHLIALEKVREKNPELRGKVTKLLIDIADQIDRQIGILPKF